MPRGPPISPEQSTISACRFFFFLFISSEKDIKEINQSIADIPKKTNKMYDRMDMIILGSSALVVGYVFCFVT